MSPFYIKVYSSYSIFYNYETDRFDATWGTGDSSTDFNTWCETVGNDMHSNGVDWLIVCEGVADSPACTDNCC